MASYLVAGGRSKTVQLLVSGSGRPQYLGFGIGAGTTAPSDVALFNETATRISGTINQVTTSTTGDTYQFVSTFTATSGITLTNLGLFDSIGSPVQGFLTSQVSSSSQNTIQINNYSSWPQVFPYSIQVSTEVMSVLSGNGSNSLYVNRGQNGSSALGTIASLTAVTQASGNLFAKVDFGGFPLTAGDQIQFTIGVQYQ